MVIFLQSFAQISFFQGRVAHLFDTAGGFLGFKGVSRAENEKILQDDT